MTDKAFGLIYTGESNMQLRELTYSRSIAAVSYTHLDVYKRQVQSHQVSSTCLGSLHVL